MISLSSIIAIIIVVIVVIVIVIMMEEYINNAATVVSGDTDGSCQRSFQLSVIQILIQFHTGTVWSGLRKSLKLPLTSKIQ